MIGKDDVEAMVQQLSQQIQEPAIEPDAAWRAVEARDTRSDGSFVYAVSSTRVFCRPSCPSRRPKRRNVEFFPSPSAAQLSGFRACRRCHPVAAQTSESLVLRLRRYLEEHFDERVTLEVLGRHLDVSPHHLQRQFKRATGVTPKEYASALRIDALKARLKDGGSVTEAIYDSGYASGSRFYERSTERLGMTASAYRRGGHGMSIEFAVVPSSVGHLLLAATERGVCSVMLGEDAASIEDELRREFPNATIRPGGVDLEKWVEAVTGSLDSLDTVDLPLDVVATAFQCQVWRALRAIPKGAAYSYGEIAAAIGNPKAARAVGTACATNPVPLLVPCHRAVREDGSVGGYRWGSDRKQRILTKERSAAGQ